MVLSKVFLVAAAAVALVGVNAELFQVYNASEFVKAAGKIEYTGEYTIILMDDIDFSEVENPTLISGLPKFTFDGQGHMIKNLKVKDDGNYAGFIYSSHGAIIRNLVVDSSCYVNSSSSEYVGGIIGFCDSTKMDCIIENSINMATVTSNAGSDFIIGGIIGTCQSANDHNCVIRGCVNYGNIFVERIEGQTFIGGISGYVYNGGIIHSSINYGTISVSCSGSSANPRIGGIVGEPNSNSKIENCVNFGNIETNTCPSTKIGGIAGYTYNSPIKNCYVDDKVGYPIATDDGNHMASDSYAFDENFNVNMTNGTNVSLTDLLNSNTPEDPVPSETGNNYFSNSVMNPNRHTVTFYVNNETYLTSNSTFIAMPTFSDGDFDGWYIDRYYQTNFTETKITGDTSLYGILTTEYTQFNKSSVLPPTVSSSSSSSSVASSSSSSSSISSSFTSPPPPSSSSSIVQPTKTVEIVFDTKVISTEEVKKIIEETAGCTDCFEIKVIETDDGFTSIIVRFEDVEQATYFFKAISAGSTQKPFKLILRSDDPFGSGSHYIIPGFVLTVFNILF